ncbi:hypothetical protein [Bradyrhizobium sp. CCBAU 11386]|uniref:hypothetical protein n=1 Tax=Bradyrhizobium sp. CCBAU 11386 TaxID=1630837 RepID=UPI002303830E|nr:hypothetical protein [Bradyrhizobium sp. CCBAU 11386]
MLIVSFDRIGSLEKFSQLRHPPGYAASLSASLPFLCSSRFLRIHPRPIQDLYVQNPTAIAIESI